MAEPIYGNYTYTYGSTAPAYPIPERRPEQEPAPQQEERVHVEAPALPQSRVRLSPGSVLGILLILGAAVAVLCSYMRLTALSVQTAGLYTELKALQEEDKRLTIEYESTFNMSEVETYAKTYIGMVPASTDQTTIIRSTEGDQAQILEEQGFFADWERRVYAGFRRILAYFR